MTSQIVQCESTSDLIEQVKEELRKVGYKARTIKAYQRYWDALLKFETTNKIKTYSPKHGLEFLNTVYGISVFSELSKQDKKRARSITFLNDYSRDRMLFPSVGCPPAISFLNCFGPTLEAFKKYRVKKYQISNTTLKRYNRYLGQFLLYLEKNGINDLEQLDPDIIFNYCSSSHSTSPLPTLYNSFCCLRVLLRYLKNEGLVGVDYSGLVPSVRYQRDSKIPSTFTKTEADRIFQAIDRSNPIGKRDYAIILMAYRLGLRSIDIRYLRFSELHWEKNTIELKMKKTGKSIVLPLLEDVGQALIDYVKFGRPISGSNYVFLRHVSPIKAISSPGIASIVKRYANKAGINCAPGHRIGAHAMRSSLASALLAENVPLPIISGILGHSSSRTTQGYLKIDIKQLRNCSLEIPEFDWNITRKEVF